MVKEGLRNVAAGAAPASLKRGIDKAVQAVNDRLLEMAKRGRRQGRRSPRSPPSRPRTAAIGELIAEAFDKVGKDGVITVEEASTTAMELDFTEGMQFDKGYISPYFVTDPERMEAVLEDAYILIHQAKISSVQDLLPLLEKVVQARQAAGHRGRGRRRRGAVHPGGQQDPRHVQRRRGQGSGLRRPPQGDAAGPRGPDRRPGRRRGGRPQARPGRPRGARHRPPRSSSPRTTPRSSTAPATRPRSTAGSAQIRAEIERTDSRLGPREAPGAAGQAGRRRLRDQGRRRHRGRAQGEEAPDRGRRLGDPRGDRGGHRRRWRLGPHPRGLGARRRPRPDRRRGDRASTSSARPPPSRCAGSPRTPARRATSWSPRCATSPVGQGYNAATGEYGDLLAAGVIDPVKVTRSALRNAASIALDGAHHRHPGGGEEGAGRGRRRGAATVTATATEH